MILPGLLRTCRELTSLAATGLMIIMAGAIAMTLLEGDVLAALVPQTAVLLSAMVAYGRSTPSTDAFDVI